MGLGVGAAFVGLCVQLWKNSNKEQKRQFVPFMMQWPTISILLGLTITLVFLLEVAVRATPQDGDPLWSYPPKSMDLEIRSVDASVGDRGASEFLFPEQSSCQASFSTTTKYTM